MIDQSRQDVDMMTTHAHHHGDASPPEATEVLIAVIDPPGITVTMIVTVPPRIMHQHDDDACWCVAIITYVLTAMDSALLADESDQADATLAQLAMRLPGDISSNAYLIGDGIAIELEDDVAEDLEPSTVGLLLRAAIQERLAALPVLPDDCWQPQDRELQRRVRAEESGPHETAEDVLRCVLAGGDLVKE